MLVMKYFSNLFHKISAKLIFLQIRQQTLHTSMSIITWLMTFEFFLFFLHFTYSFLNSLLSKLCSCVVKTRRMYFILVTYRSDSYMKVNDCVEWYTALQSPMKRLLFYFQNCCGLLELFEKKYSYKCLRVVSLCSGQKYALICSFLPWQTGTLTEDGLNMQGVVPASGAKWVRLWLHEHWHVASLHILW